MMPPIDLVATPRRVTVIPAVPPPHTLSASARMQAVVAFWLFLCLVLGAATALGAQGTAPRPDSAKAAAPRAINWTSDRRTFLVGDILQVSIDEYALAQATKDNANSASRRRRLEMGATPPEMPGGNPLPALDASIETGDGGESRQRGTASRDTRYVGELAVRVIAVTKEGLLQIRGTKTIDVDKNKATLTLSGFVRPIDVGARDNVRSEAIADAEIAYQAKGGLGKPKNGIMTRILGLFWP